MNPHFIVGRKEERRISRGSPIFLARGTLLPERGKKAQGKTKGSPASFFVHLCIHILGDRVDDRLRWRDGNHLTWGFIFRCTMQTPEWEERGLSS